MVFEMKRAYADGTVALRFTPEELVARLVVIVPPAGANQIVYRGVLAGERGLARGDRTEGGTSTWPVRHGVGAADEEGEGSCQAASCHMG